MLIQTIIQKRMKTDPFQDQNPMTDLGRILDENSLREQLIKLIYKFAKSVTKTSTKVREPKTYNEAINDLIYSNRWRKAIDEVFWNLNSYYI